MKNKIFTLLIVALVAISASAREPQRGYRGFVDLSNSVRSMSVWADGHKENVLYSGLATSHGFQFNPNLFVGAGFDMDYCEKLESHVFALFAQARTDFKLGKLTPFGDVRLGYNLADGGGLYFSPMVGHRFNWGRKVGINVGVGMTLQGYKVDQYEVKIDQEQGWAYVTKTGSRSGSKAFFSFRVGLDF